MKLLVQKYLLNKSLGDLAKEHGVYASFSKSGHKFSLNYDMIEAKESDPLSQQCRGLILAAVDGRSFLSEAKTIKGRANYDHVVVGETVVVAHALDRFFNLGQGVCAKLDWNDAGLKVQEKLDGTLIILNFDPFTQQWCAATRSVPEADLTMDNGIFTFRTLFEKALTETTGETFQQYTAKLNTEITYCFELTTPYNRIVVDYPDCRITLLAGRRLSDHQELDTDTINSYGVPKVQEHSFSTIEELVSWVSERSPKEHEGVVIKDSQFRRIKVKSSVYSLYNSLHDRLGNSERNILEIILLGQDDDVAPMMPDAIADNLRKIKTDLQEAIKQYDQTYLQLKIQADAINPGDKKTFALLVNQRKEMWSSPFYQLFSGKATSMSDFILLNKENGTWSVSFLDRLLELSKT